MNTDEYTTLKDELIYYLEDCRRALSGPEWISGLRVYSFASAVNGSMSFNPEEPIFMAAELFNAGERA